MVVNKFSPPPPQHSSLPNPNPMPSQSEQTFKAVSPFVAFLAAPSTWRRGAESAWSKQVAGSSKRKAQCSLEWNACQRQIRVNPKAVSSASGCSQCRGLSPSTFPADCGMCVSEKQGLATVIPSQAACFTCRIPRLKFPASMMSRGSKAVEAALNPALNCALNPASQSSSE